jgi:hypothetical protein
VPQHELDNPNVNTIGEQSAGAFMSQIVPPEIDFVQPLSVPSLAISAAAGLEAVRQQAKCLPSRLTVGLILAGSRARYVA